MITLHHEKETDFTKNGYGSLDDNIVTPEVFWEMNSEFKFSFDYPLFGSNEEITSHLTNRNLVRVPVPYMDDQFFRIYRTKEVLGYVRVEARHLFYDLIDNLIEDTNIVGKNGLGALTQLLNATQYTHKFNAFSDIDSITNMRIVRYNPVKALLDDSEDNTFVNRWGGELYRDNYNIHMRKRLGTNRGIKIEHKKDLLGYEATIDESTIATRIMPKGFDGLLLPEKYVDSPLLDPDNPKIRVVEYSDVMAAVGDYEDYEDAIPLSEAYEELRRLAREEFSVHNVDEPETVIHVDFITLENTKEYEEFSELQEIHQGDTVQVSVPEQGFEITSRLVAFTSDPLRKNHYTSTTLGNHVLEYTNSRTEIDVIRKEIKNTNELALIARQAANGKNTNFYGTVDPNTIELTAQLGDTYFQEDGDYFAIWEYVEVNGERYWRKGPNTDFGKEISNQIKDAIEEITEAKQTADEAVNRINGEIAGKFTSLDTEISQVHQDAQNALNQAGEAVSQVAYFGETLDGFTQTVANIDGRVTNIRHDVDGITQTVTDQTGKIATVEQNVNGIQQTVSDPVNGLVTQVSTLASGFNVLATDFEDYQTSLLNILTHNVSDWELGGFNISTGSEAPSNTRFRTKGFIPLQGVNYVSLDSTRYGEFILLFYDKDKRFVGGSKNTWNNIRTGTYEVPAGTKYFRANSRYSGNNSFSSIEDVGIGTNVKAMVVKGAEIMSIDKFKESSPLIQAQLSVLNDNINLRVTKGELLSQINIEAGRTLIQSDKLLLNASSTVITGTAWMDGAVIANASIDGAKIQDATIGSAKIASLDVSKISGNTSNFVQSNWNANGSDVRITGSGLLSTASDGSQTYLQNGVVGTRNPSGNSIGHIGYSNLTGTMTYAITTAAGAHFAIGSNQINDHYGPIPLFQIIAGSNETYIRTNNFRHTGTDLGGDVFARFSGDVTIDKELRMGGTNIVQPYGIYFNNTGSSIYSTSSGSFRLDTSSSGIIQFRVSGDQKFRIDSTRNYSSQILNMQGNSIVESPSVSDARMKDIYGIRTDNDLEKLMKIEYVDFRWKDPEYGDEDLGFVAQQVQGVAPELITEVAGGMLGYNQQTYLNFLGHSVQQLALRELNTNQVASQALQLGESNEEKIERLEKRIEELESAA